MKHLYNFDNYRVDEQMTGKFMKETIPSSNQKSTFDAGGFDSVKDKFPKMLKEIESSQSDTGPAPYNILKIFRAGVHTMVKKSEKPYQYPGTTSPTSSKFGWSADDAAIKLIVGFGGGAQKPEEVMTEWCAIGARLIGFFGKADELYNKVMAASLGSSSNLPNYKQFLNACKDLCEKNGIETGTFSYYPEYTSRILEM